MVRHTFKTRGWQQKSSPCCDTGKWLPVMGPYRYSVMRLPTIARQRPCPTDKLSAAIFWYEPFLFSPHPAQKQYQGIVPSTPQCALLCCWRNGITAENIKQNEKRNKQVKPKRQNEERTNERKDTNNTASTRRCDNFEVLVLFSGVPRRGCGIQRTPGDNVMVEKRNKKYITGVLMQGCVNQGGCVIFRVIYGMFCTSYRSI